MGAGHEVAALVALQEHALDAAEVLDGGGGAGDDFAVPVVLGAADAELDLVTFCAGRLGVAVGFVEEDDAAADATEAAGRVGADQAERSTGELLLEDGVGAVLGFGFADEAGEAGGVAQHWRNFFLRITLRVLNRGLNQHDGAGVLVDVVRDYVVKYFGIADPCAFHYGYLL